MSSRPIIARSRAREDWLAWLATAAFVVLFASFVGTAIASGCPSGMDTRDSAIVSSCCSETNCIGGTCLVHASHRDCKLAAYSTALQPLGAENLKKRCTPSMVSAWPAAVVPRANLAQPPPVRTGPTGIARYADIFARTGRLLI